MPRGKRLPCPRIVVVRADRPKYASRDEAWAVACPVLARILAQIILREEDERERKNKKKITRKRGSSA
jgi:hypothetical protein